MKLYSYGPCTTCRKALAWLKERGLVVSPIDITTHPPSREELVLALEQLGRKRLFNTSGQSYRALGASTVAAMSDQEVLDALVADGKLIKRPVLITDQQQVITGFKPEAWQALLG